MKGSKLSLALTAALLCSSGKLDLSCPPFTAAPTAKAPLVGFEPLNPLYADKAYVIRLGESRKRDAEPRWTVQLGSAFRQAMFWAAVASILL